MPVKFPGTDYRHAWEWFDATDNLGSLGYLTPEVRLSAVTTVTEGVTVNLTLPLDLPDPPMFGRQPLQHSIFELGRNNLDDRLDSLYTQASTQWDGFRHVRAREAGFFTGVTEFSAGDDRLGINHFATQGIVGRGVLLDLAPVYRHQVEARGLDSDCYFSPTDIQAALEAADVTPRHGDIVCIRTGWLEQYLSWDHEARTNAAKVRRWPGLAATAAMAELLWDWGVAAVTADNPAVEWGPGAADQGNLHRRMIPLLGVPFGEFFDFEELHRRCGRLARHEFLFTAAPLNLPGGVGSTGNAVALL